MSIVTIVTTGRSDGTAASVSFGAPINQSYSGSFTNNQCVINVPDADLALDTDGTATCTWSVPNASNASGSFTATQQAGGQPTFTTPVAGSTLTSNTIQFAFDWDRRIDIQIHGSDPGSVASDGLDDTTGFTAANSTWSTTQPNGNYWVRAVWPDETDVWPTNPQDNYDAGRFLTFQVTVAQPASSGTSVLTYSLPSPVVTSVSSSVWDTMTGNTHNDLTGSASDISIVSEGGQTWIKAFHRAGQATDLTAKSNLGNIAPSARTKMVMKLADNFATGTNQYNSGKLGLGLKGGSTPHSSGNFNVPVSGGSTATTGWSMRHGFDRENNNNTGAIKHLIYAYYINRPGMNYPGTPPSSLFGEFIFTGIDLVPGETHEWWLDVHMNTAGNTDGSIEVWLDGVSVLIKTGMIFMDGTPVIDQDFWASNHGGGGSVWAPPSETYALYRDMEILEL